MAKTNTPDKQENPLFGLLFNIVVPVMALNTLSKEDGLLGVGPVWALVIAMTIPLGYGIWDYNQRREVNFFSVIGIVGVTATGIFGLLKTDPIWFAAKEAALPSLMGIYFIASQAMGKPFIREFFLNPQMVDVDKIQRRINANNAQSKFDSLLWKCTVGMACTMFACGIASFFIALHLLEGLEPGSEEYNKGIGKTMWVGFLAVGLPMMVGMLGLFWFLCRSLSKLTGLDWDDLTTQGETVRRKVKKGEAKSNDDAESKDPNSDT